MRLFNKKTTKYRVVTIWSVPGGRQDGRYESTCYGYKEAATELSTQNNMCRINGYTVVDAIIERCEDDEG